CAKLYRGRSSVINKCRRYVFSFISIALPIALAGAGRLVVYAVYGLPGLVFKSFLHQKRQPPQGVNGHTYTRAVAHWVGAVCHQSLGYFHVSFLWGGHGSA